MSVERANDTPAVERILVVDDEPAIRDVVVMLLEGQGYEITQAGSYADGCAALGRGTFDLVVSDLRLGDGTGLQLLEHLAATPDAPPAILMTSYSSVESAVEALRLGAVDYIIKPFDNDELIHSVQRAIRERRMRRENTLLKRTLRKVQMRHGLVGESAGLKRVLDLMRRVAPSDATVLVTGESGTGKELVAQAIHYGSGRAAGPFVPVNCGAIPAELIESELFGHVKGAYTGATVATEGLIREAHGGTLFLDEVGELPLALQVKFLRVLQDKRVRPVGGKDSFRVDVRFLAATNKDLKAAVERGEFREDLYYRLNVISIRVPPLRERGTDVELLARHFTAHYASRLGKRIAGFDDEFTRFLHCYDWPGNVRELENLIERAVILADEEVLCYRDLADGLPPVPPERETAGAASNEPLPVEDYIREVILRYQDTHSEVELANMLGIGRKALWMRRRRWGLPRQPAAVAARSK